MTNKPRVGDKVRVTYTHEGEVSEVLEQIFRMEPCSYHEYVTDSRYYTANIEILERAKPKWQDGDVAECMEVGLRFRLGGKWYNQHGKVETTDDSTANYFDYKLIMRDGKPVL